MTLVFANKAPIKAGKMIIQYQKFHPKYLPKRDLCLQRTGDNKNDNTELGITNPPGQQTPIVPHRLPQPISYIHV